MALTERVQVLLSPELRRRLEDRAEREGKSLGALIREFAEIGLGSGGDRSAKLAALKRIFAMGLPVADWDEMERQIEAGKLGD